VTAEGDTVNTSFQWSGQKVLVTGANGFLGAHLCRRLCAAGSIVHATSRAYRAGERDGPRWWQGDVADYEAARKIVAEVKPDVIYHLSGMVSASPNVELVLPTFHSLLASTINFLTLSTEAGCRRIVLIASLTEPKASADEPVPASPYAAAKWASSLYGRMFQRLYGTPCVMVRPFMVYGPGQDRRKIVPSVIDSMLRGQAPQLSSGRWQADWVYVDDVIEGFLRAAQADGVDGLTLDFGSGTLTSIRDMVCKLVNLMHATLSPNFGAFPDRPFEPVRTAEIEETYARLGWRASTPLEVGLQKTIVWYRDEMHSSNRVVACG
jgi:nucleoside-diphosphate-sugar epimerase